MMTRITHILCPIDFSDCSRHALDHAAAIARWYEARLTVLFVAIERPSMDVPMPPLDDAGRRELMADLRRFTKHVSSEVSLVLCVQEAPYADDEILAQASAL